MYKCEFCNLEIDNKQKTNHIRRKHADSIDDLSRYHENAKQCTKLYAEVIQKINEIETLEECILKLNPRQKFENKKWFADYINNRNTFMEIIRNIVTD